VLVNKPISIVNPSPAALFTLIDMEHPTLLLDEINRTFARKDTSEITLLINSGFKRGVKVPRVSLEPRRIEYFDVFGPVVVSGIDNNKMPDTIVDRSIPIRLKRRRDEPIEGYRPRNNEAEGIALRTKIASWAAGIIDRAKALKPTFPKGIEQRNADKWEALFIVADVTDVSDISDVTANSEGWGKRAREAALSLLEENDEEDTSSYGERLLKDIQELTDVKGEIPSHEIIRKLIAIDEAPWGSFEWGKPLSQRGLARLLKPFGIRPKQMRISGKDNPVRGYHLSDFEDAWRRYLPTPPLLPVTTDTSVTSVTDKGVCRSRSMPSIRSLDLPGFIEKDGDKPDW
jgi:hypothetical protein